MAKKSGKNVYLVALLLFLGGVGYLAYSGFSENSVYFLNVSEALATPSDKLKAARLFGTVAEDGTTYAIDAAGTVTATAADGEKRSLERTIEGFRGFLYCLEGAQEKGIVYGSGAWKKGDIKESPALNEAYEMGRHA